MKATYRASLLIALALFAAPAVTMTGSDVGAQVKHNCSFCHNLHGGGFSALQDFAVSEDLCISCHGDAGPAQVDRDGTLVTVPRQEGIHNGPKHTSASSCWNCHDHEGSADTNIFMIPRVRNDLPQGGSATITFTNNQTQADFIGSEGVCYGCHTDIGTQGNGFAGHNGPDVCTNCHSHDGGFQGAGGGCTTCHNSGRGNHREVVSEFDRASHHVQLGGPAVDIPDTDCTTCHDQVGHPRAGTDHVVLVNQDDLSTFNYEAGVTATSVLTPFCLSCHDADGGQGGDTSPFSDNITRPEIDEAAWTISSHAAGNDCADCHEGHGSEKVRLLAPGGFAPDPTTLYEEEEGFCLVCHDSDGPATSDMATSRSLPINWVQTATGLNSNPYLNDRHDIEWAAQDSSGAKIECTNCHNPHTATAAQPWIPDPDPGDGHVPGTDWYFTEYQTAGDILSEFCLDCHDGSVSAGVVEGHGGLLTNLQATWGGDGMGGRTGGSVDLRAGTGWTTGVMMPCAACHTAHVEVDTSPTSAGVTTLFRMRDQAWSQDGATELFYKDRKASDPQIYDYSIINNLDNADETSGGYYCNTCHNRYAMTGKSNCYSCHRHGDGGRF